MVSYSKELSTIKDLLKENPQGMTITDISRVLNVYRKTTAKYLDMLLITGQVEMRPFGPVKIFTPSRRIPVSSMLNFSKDSILVLDREHRILDTNDPMLRTLRTHRDSLIGRSITDPSLPFGTNESLLRNIEDSVSGRSFHGSLAGPGIPGFADQTIRIEPVTFDDGSEGASLVFINDEGRRHLEEDLRRRDALLRIVSSLASRHPGSGTSFPTSDHLGKIGTPLHANRVYLCRNTGGGQADLAYSRFIEWVDRSTYGLTGDSEFDTALYRLIGSRMRETLSHGRVFLGKVRDFLDFEREHFNRQGILSLACVPVFVDGEWWGFLGVDHCDREWEWSPGEIEGLKAITGVIGILLDREPVEEYGA